MGFYYNSGGPSPEEKQGSLKEVVLITWVVLKMLALPMAILFGGVAVLVGLFYLFSLSSLAGVSAIGVVLLAVLARGVWEWRHPPVFK